MTTENKIMVRGDNETLTWTYSGDHSARKVIFVVKANRTLTTARTIERKNLTAGGSNTQMTVTYSSTTGLSTITVFITPALTSQLTAKDYWYDITSEDASDSDDHETILQGKFTLQGDVQSPYDAATVIGALTPSKKISFYVADADTITKLSSSGWTITPTAVASSGIFTITSSGGEFTSGKTKLFPTLLDINWTFPDENTCVITGTGTYPFSFDMWVD